MSHGINLYEEAVRVPLVASWPGHLAAARVVDEPVALIDVAPGILDSLSLEAGSFTHGRKLFGATDSARQVFLQRRDYKSSSEGGQKIRGEMSAVVANGSKLILAPGENRREFYDLATDPHELVDLLGGGPANDRERAAAAAAPPARLTKAEAEAGATRLDGLLRQWHKQYPAALRSHAAPDKETQKALRSLGYIE
jgi:arylsulfatase A-like enzyme